MSARATLLLDANVVIRLLTGQPQEQHTAAVRLFERAAEGEVALGLQVLTLAEIAWVLDAVYGCSRSVIAEHLSALLETPGVVVPMRNVVENAIERFTRTGVDFADAWLAACAVAQGKVVASFDRDFGQFPDVQWQVPS